MARFVPIIIQVTDKDSDKIVGKIRNAFKQLPHEAEQSAKGSSNAFSQHLGAEFFAGLGRQAFNAFLQQGKQFIVDSVQLAQELQNSLKGIGSIGEFYGVPSGQVEQRLQELEAVKLGMLSVADATRATKPLLQFFKGDVGQAIEVVDLFSRSAAFGRQAALGYGESIVGASEGLKNMNPILMDNAGVTRNASLIMKDYGLELQDLDDKAKGAGAREKLLLGLRKEVAGQMGDLVKSADTYTGSIAAQDKSYQDLQRALGLIIITNPALIESNKIVAEQFNETTEAIKDQDSESAKFADNTVIYWAKIKAGAIPLMAFLKNLFQSSLQGILVVVTASVAGVLKGLEFLVGAVAKTVETMVNTAINGVNVALNAARQLPGGSVLPVGNIAPFKGAPVDFGSNKMFENLDKAATKYFQILEKADKANEERIRAFRRIDQQIELRDYQRRFTSKPGESGGDMRLARANELAETLGTSGTSGARKKAAAEHLSDIQKIDQTSERATLKTLYQLGQRSGFVAGTNQSAAAHNKGSLHPLGRALDFSVKGKSPAQVAQFIKELREEGFTVFDERTRPPGQKVWGGPHLHAQFAAGGIGKDKGFGPTDFAVRALMGQMRGGPIQANAGSLNELLPEMRLTKDQEYLKQRKEFLDLDKQAAEAALRRRNLEAEIRDDQRQGTIDLINLETDLMKFRTQAADDQFTDQRRLLVARSEELDLLRRTQEVEDELANGPLNQSLRIRLALLDDIADIRRRDEDAMKDKNRAELELADATIYHATQADAAVLRFLASQRSVTEVIADAKVGVIQTTFDLIDRGLDKFTSKLGIMGSLVKELLSGFIRLALSKFFQATMGGGGGQQAGGRSGGGIGGFIGNLFGGLRGGAQSGLPGGGGGGGGVTAPFLTGGFSGGPGGGGFLGFGGGGGITGPVSAQARALSGLGLGAAAGFGALSVPASLSSGLASQTAISSAIHEAGHTAAGAAASGAGAFSLAGLGASLAPILPFLGLTAGAGLGGSSRFGSILGGAGGLLGGVGLAAALSPGFALGLGGIIGGLPGLAGLGGWLSATSGLALLGPIAAIAAPLIIAAIILAKNSARRRDETTRNQAMLDSLSQLDEIIRAVKTDKMDVTSAIGAAAQIRQQYVTSMSALKDSKTRRIALQDVYRLDLKIDEIKKAGEGQDRRREIERKLVPAFAQGGLVPYGNTMFSMITGLTPIKVRPGEVMIPPGGFGVTVPGVDRGVDSVYTMAPPRTRILTKAQQASAHGFASGGTVGGFGSGEGQPIEVHVYLNPELTIGKETAGKIVAVGATTSDGRKAVIHVHKDYAEHGN